MSSITPKPGMTVEISMQGIEKSRLDAIEAAESMRKANEAERAEAEFMRKEGETGRITAEQERTMEEDARNLAESGRILAEESRVTAENLRSNGEQSRAEAEKGRSIAESGRANAEQQRVESDEMRENAEASRVTAETARANAEALRQQTFETNEANRHTAFESAENARESEWTEIKSNVETSVGSAVASAYAATDAANTAADNANAAAEKSVRYDVAQKISDAQKAQARENIEAASEADVNELKDDLAAITPDDNALNGKPWTSRKIVEALCPPFETTGSIVQCHPVEHYPLGVVSRIEPVQSGSGNPSSDNVRPISGWDSVHVTRCGKNLLKASKSDITRELNGIVGNYTANNDTFAIKGTNKASSNFIILSITPYVYPYVKPGDKYTILNNSPNGIYINLTYINTSGNIASLVYNDTQTTFTVPEDYIRLNKLQVGISTSVSTVDTTFNIQLEVGSTATAYEPYTGDTYTAELPETIYGGELDWNTGVLTVDRMVLTLGVGTNNFTEKDGFWNTPYRCAPGVSNSTYYDNNILCSHFKNKFAANGTYEFIFTTSDTMSGLFSTIDELNAYLSEQYSAGTPVQVCYKLATPTTIQLTPQQITALSGTNTLYTDSGDTAVSDRADPVWLTQSLMERIAALESAATNI